MKFISWNVNGIRACVQKGFLDFFKEAVDGYFLSQETKLQEGQIELETPGYYQYWNYAERKGYSGTAVFTKKEPLSVAMGIGIEEHDKEGRVITLEYEDFYFVTVYTPNSQNELARLPYRMRWEDDFLAYIQKLDEEEARCLVRRSECGSQEIDLKNPKTNRKNAGFTDEERAKMTQVLESGFIDTFRYFYPERKESIPGGLTVLKPERRTLAGASTIFWSLNVCGTVWKTQKSIQKSLAQTTVR